MRTRGFISILSVIVVAAACSTGRVAQSSLPEVSKARDPEKPSTSGGWFPRQRISKIKFSIHDSSIITMNADSAHSSSIESSTVISLAIQPEGDSLALTADVESLTIVSHSPKTKTTSDSTQSQIVHALISSSGKITALSARSSALCVGGNDPVAARIFDLTLTYPRDRIKAGDKWTDTTTFTSCRGKTALRQQNIHQYEMIGRTNWKGHTAVQLQRTTSTLFDGAAVDIGNHPSTNGSGTSTMLYYVDESSGSVYAADGKSVANLSVTTSRGSFSFLQATNTQIEQR